MPRQVILASRAVLFFLVPLDARCGTRRGGGANLTPMLRSVVMF
jgi:hypothetical protein